MPTATRTTKATTTGPKARPKPEARAAPETPRWAVSSVKRAAKTLGLDPAGLDPKLLERAARQLGRDAAKALG